MTDPEVFQVDEFIDRSLEAATRLEQALGRFAQSIELGLVDIELDPAIITNGRREKLAALGEKLAEFSGVSYELVRDLSKTVGIPIEMDGILAADPIVSRNVVAPPAERPALQPPTTSPEPVTSEATPVPPEQPAAIDSTPERAFPPVEDLYARIVDPEILPRMPEVQPGEAIHAIIWDDHTMKFGANKVEFNNHSLYALNAVLLLRDKERAPQELRALGFKGEGRIPDSQQFSQVLRRTVENINKAAGKEIITKTGKDYGTGVRYLLNPNLVLIDVRDSTGLLVADTTAVPVKKN